MKDNQHNWRFEPMSGEAIKLEQELKIYKLITEVIQNNKDEFLWEPCDCGCPGKSTARSKAAVDIIRLLKVLEEPAEHIERKEWKASLVEYSMITEIFVESEDFTHDVRLHVIGDFEDQDQCYKYAESIAAQLNKKDG